LKIEPRGFLRFATMGVPATSASTKLSDAILGHSGRFSEIRGFPLSRRVGSGRLLGGGFVPTSRLPKFRFQWPVFEGGSVDGAEARISILSVIRGVVTHHARARSKKKIPEHSKILQCSVLFRYFSAARLRCYSTWCEHPTMPMFRNQGCSLLDL
jgi:hypothetical protein